MCIAGYSIKFSFNKQCQPTLLYCLFPYQFLHWMVEFVNCISDWRALHPHYFIPILLIKVTAIVCARFPSFVKAMIANKQNNLFKSTRARRTHVYFQQIRYGRSHSHTVSANFCYVVWANLLCVSDSVRVRPTAVGRRHNARRNKSCIQWNLSIVNSHGTPKKVHYTEVFTQ